MLTIIVCFFYNLVVVVYKFSLGLSFVLNALPADAKMKIAQIPANRQRENEQFHQPKYQNANCEFQVI